MITDKEGNTLYRVNNSIFLRLISEEYRRKIAIIEEDTLIMKRNSNVHLHRKSNSYGFNYNLLTSSEIVKKVELIINGKEKYEIPISVILEKGEFLFFKQQGFEKQIFLNMDIIKSFKK